MRKKHLAVFQGGMAVAWLLALTPALAKATMPALAPTSPPPDCQGPSRELTWTTQSPRGYVLVGMSNDFGQDRGETGGFRFRVVGPGPDSSMALFVTSQGEARTSLAKGLGGTGYGVGLTRIGAGAQALVGGSGQLELELGVESVLDPRPALAAVHGRSSSWAGRAFRLLGIDGGDPYDDFPYALARASTSPYGAAFYQTQTHRLRWRVGGYCSGTYQQLDLGLSVPMRLTEQLEARTNLRTQLSHVSMAYLGTILPTANAYAGLALAYRVPGKYRGLFAAAVAEWSFAYMQMQYRFAAGYTF